MRILKGSIVIGFCILLVVIFGRISRSLAYGVNHPGEFTNCEYPQRSPEHIDPIHAGETGVLKKHVCSK